MNPTVSHDGKWWISGKAFVNDIHIRFKMTLLFVVVPLIMAHSIGVYYYATHDYAQTIAQLVDINKKVLKYFPEYLFSPKYAEVRELASKVNTANYETIKAIFLKPLPYTMGSGVIYWLFLIYIARKAKDLGYIKGARLLSESDYIKAAKKLGPIFFFIGKIPLPIENETSHVFMVGASGRGKTLAMRKVMKKAVSSNKRGLILDVKGDWIPDLFRANTDLIFNPLDMRSIRWTVFNDIMDPVEIRNFTNWIIPVTNQKSPFFEEASRFILESIMLKCIDTNKKTNEEIRRLSGLSSYDLSQELEGYGRGATYVGANGNRDVFATFQRAMAFIDFLEDGQFSIKEYINNDKAGFIFLSNTPKTAEAFKPLLTAFVNVFVSQALLLPDDLKRRIYIFLDEFGRLGKIEQIKDLVLLGRSKGASLWLTSQDLNQISTIYSLDEMLSIINAFSNFVVMGLNEPKGAKFWSEKFGTQDFYEISETIGMGPHANRDGLNLNKQKKTDLIIKDSEILYLKKREMFVKLDGISACAKTSIEIIPASVNSPALIEREISIQSMIKLMERETELEQTLKEKKEEYMKEESKGFYAEALSTSEKDLQNADDFTY